MMITFVANEAAQPRFWVVLLYPELLVLVLAVESWAEEQT